MTTDPARVRRTDPGDPDKCPVWQFHKVYSDEATQDWVVQGCTSAGIGCLDCKQPVIDAIVKEQQPWRERAEALTGRPQEGALDRRDGHRARAHRGPADDEGRARGHGPELLTALDSGVRPPRTGVPLAAVQTN
jgi:hypothetical protein